MWDPAGLPGRLSCSRQAPGDNTHVSQVTPGSQESRKPGGAGQETEGKARALPGCPGSWVFVGTRSSFRASVRRVELSRDTRRGQGSHSLSRSFTGLAGWPDGKGIPSEAKRPTERGAHRHNLDRELPGETVSSVVFGVKQQVRTCAVGSGSPTGVRHRGGPATPWVRVGRYELEPWAVVKTWVRGSMRWRPGVNATLFYVSKSSLGWGASRGGGL